MANKTVVSRDVREIISSSVTRYRNTVVYKDEKYNKGSLDIRITEKTHQTRTYILLLNEKFEHQAILTLRATYFMDKNLLIK